MPRVRRRRTLAAAPERLWPLVADPVALGRWWPGVERVEEATAGSWTKVLRSSKGKAVRADFTRTRAESPRVLEWRQELVESPFERFLSESLTRVSLTAQEPGRTRVELDARRRLRGLALLGWPLVRRATRRQLDEALAGLAAELEADDTGARHEADDSGEEPEADSTRAGPA